MTTSSEAYFCHSNALLSSPDASIGMINRELLASDVVGRKATLSASAYADFQFSATAGIRSIGVDGLELRSGVPSISFAFSNLTAGGSELGSFSRTPSLTAGYELQAWVLDSALPEARYCRVTFSNCAAVGLCWAGKVLNPAIGILADMTRQPVDLSVTTRSSLTGASTTLRRPMYRTVGVDFMIDTDEEFADFDDMVNAMGTNSQVILIPGFGDVRRNRDMVLGRFVDLRAMTHRAGLLMQWPFQIEQSL